MNNLPRLLSLFLLLALAACAAPGFNQATLDKAEKGDMKAMFRLADYYCAREDAAAKGTEALKWWGKIAEGEDATAAAQANEYLGLFHLSLFANEDTYTPDAPEPLSYCTGSPDHPAYAKALKHFTRCADAGAKNTKSCQTDLGHLFLHRKDYAKAYFWYATVLAGFMNEIYGPDHANEISPLDPEISTTLAAQNARRAAEHLTTEKAAAIAKRASDWVKNREKAKTEKM